jgi:ribonuclease R
VRHLPLVTIDGETARDFDDAVYCRACRCGLPSAVAIADVSAYVQPGDPLDQEALNRSTSVIFAARNPDAAEELSNGLCSINPEVTACAWCATCMSLPMAISKNIASILL